MIKKKALCKGKRVFMYMQSLSKLLILSRLLSIIKIIVKIIFKLIVKITYFIKIIIKIFKKYWNIYICKWYEKNHVYYTIY